MGEKVMIDIEKILGRAECRSWFEAGHSPGGELRLVGTGSYTEYDRHNRVIAHRVEPTGVVLTMAVDRVEPPRSWLSRLLRPNGKA